MAPRIPTIKLSPTANSDRSPATLSFHSAHRLASSLASWKAEIDAEVARGSEDLHYQGLIYETIRVEARHLIHWCTLQGLITDSDYYDGITESLLELIESTGTHGMFGMIGDAP
jgi:hypothetical protein